jgi:hypothetical protein
MKRPGRVANFAGDPSLGRMKTITIPYPYESQTAMIFWTNTAITIANVTSVINDSSSGSTVFYELFYSAERDGSGGFTMLQANIACSNTTTGNVQTSFSNNVIAANTYAFVSILSANNITTRALHLTLRF